MRLGIMQPYFFPYLGHFGLIAAVDEWVVFDITQYTKKSWINRNRILDPNGDWQYVSVPLKRSTTQMKICEAQVADPATLHESLRGKLAHYRKKAPYFHRVLEVVDKSFSAVADDSLVALNVASLQCVCDYIGIPFRYRICSELALDFPPEMGAGDWAPQVARQLGATCYVNPEGGRGLFAPSDFTQHGIELCFAKFNEFSYDIPGYAFVPGLSVLDVLMWNDPKAVRSAAYQNNVLLPAEI